jgi:hypothetical protein
VVPDLVALLKRHYQGRRLNPGDRFTPRSKRDADTLIKLRIAKAAPAAEGATTEPRPPAKPADRPIGRPETPAPTRPPAKPRGEPAPAEEDTPAPPGEARVVDSNVLRGPARRKPN